MSAPKNLDEFIERFTKITEMGWIETHRTGRTGIGKTLEDLLEIEELLTLLTKSPLPDGANARLLEAYGYISDAYKHKRKVLHATLSAGHFAQIADTGKSLSINCSDNKIAIVDSEGNSFAYWTEETLRNAFNKKYPYSMIHAYADSQQGERKEEFYFHTSYELSEFSFEKLLVQLREGKVKVDIRIGQYPNGKTHDHGTGFRIQDRALTEIFLNKRMIVGEN